MALNTLASSVDEIRKYLWLGSNSVAATNFVKEYS